MLRPLLGSASHGLVAGTPLKRSLDTFAEVRTAQVRSMGPDVVWSIRRLRVQRFLSTAISRRITTRAAAPECGVISAAGAGGQTAR